MADSGNIRNICILAHVDHGKTTLADHLIASCGGGLLHPKLAGRLRYMDYLDEEQRRAITMKSSSIALRFPPSFSINLIDSPGHMDFCSEVSTAARLSDGALVLVDAVEGVHIQTHAVLRQAWVEKLTPCLVLNKIDRLITELRLSPMEAYTRLQRIIHEVNGIMSAYRSQKYLSDVDSLLAAPGGVDSEVDLEELVEDDEGDTFQPQKGNVAFVCALDGWGFCISRFAEIYAAKLGASAATLMKGLWGPRYYNTKKMMIVGKKGMEGFSKDPQPMFVQFVLKPLWQVYQAALEDGGDRAVLDKVIKNFNLSVPPRELQNKDSKAVLQAVMSRWLPLSDTILSMVVKCVPDPASAQAIRIQRLMPKRELPTVNGGGPGAEVAAEAERLRRCVETCDSRSEAPCVAFVSKMFAVPFKILPQRGPGGGAAEDLSLDEVSSGEGEECFLAFTRIFSGVFRSGQRIFVLSALYNPLHGEPKHIQEAELHSLYMMMGQGLKPVSSASAGNIVAIRGLGRHILKSATLSSTRNCWPFTSMMFQVAPTLKVAIEPSDPTEMSALIRGLKLLDHADPFVEVSISSRGEHVLAAAGEVHLERCIKDLKERFAKVSLEVSPPLVSYKETIEGETSNPLENLRILSETAEFIEKITPNGRCLVRVQVMKIPNSLTKIFDENAVLLVDILEGKPVEKIAILGDKDENNQEGNSVSTLRKRLLDAIQGEIESSSAPIDEDRLDRYKTMWFQLLKRIWSLGPRHVGPNILLVPGVRNDNTVELSDGKVGILIGGSPYVSEKLGFLDASSSNENGGKSTNDVIGEMVSLHLEAESLKSSIISGFQLATAAGPLCDEPMWGLAFLVEAYLMLHNLESSSQHDQYGQVMATVKDACRAAVLKKKPRLVEAMYFCELNSPTEYLGSMYAVLARRRAKVLKEEMQEGSSLFTVHAYVPVSESFGFSDELRRWTSGAASALLVLSHWEALEEDPFFVPKTEEEIEEFGDGSSVLPNTARKLIDAVRRRKGLPVEEKVVQHATKQRTLARKV